MEVIKGNGRTKGRNSTELMITVDVETITRPSDARGKAGNPCAGFCSWLGAHPIMVAGVTVTVLCFVAAGVLAGVFGSLRANALKDNALPPYNFTGCGVRPEQSSRIVNGEVSRLPWPWQVSLQNRNSAGVWTHFCGASIVSPTWLITAKHCITPFKNVSDVIAVMGTNSLTDGGTAEQKVAIVAAVQLDALTDVALLRLGWSVTYSPTVGPVCLPPQGRTIQPGTLCYVTGWGITIQSDKNSAPTDLYEGHVTIVDDSRCTITNNNYAISSNMLCASNTTTKSDTCQGDSGGPLVNLEQDGLQSLEGRWVLEGITRSGNGCGMVDFPGIYTRVSAISSWIANITNASSSSSSKST